jgi:NitT/TauT family transport system ATP-binding protein
MNPITVDVRGKTFPNGVCAIRELAFSARAGEFVAIVGPSGAGKTTLLTLIAGLDRDMDGDISIAAGPAPLRRARIGFVFQEPRLMPWLTARQNIELVLKPWAAGRDAAADRARLGVLLDLVGLQGFDAMFPGQLSVGMNRRIALLRAFIIEPDLLLMDEPFQSLDAPTAAQLRSLLVDLWRRTAPTVLFVTHDLPEALSLADRILFLSARPATVILDYAVPPHRLRPPDSAAVQRLQQQLLCRYPRLLEGSLAGSRDPAISNPPCAGPADSRQ